MRMKRPWPIRSFDEIRSSVLHGEVIEDYPEDIRGHSCLMLGWGKQGRPIHVVCAPKDEYLAIISVYIPDPERWEPDWRTRRGRKI